MKIKELSKPFPVFISMVEEEGKKFFLLQSQGGNIFGFGMSCDEALHNYLTHGYNIKGFFVDKTLGREASFKELDNYPSDKIDWR